MGNTVRMECPHCEGSWDEELSFVGSGDSANCVDCGALVRVTYTVLILNEEFSLIKPGAPELAHDYVNPNEDEE